MAEWIKNIGHHSRKIKLKYKRKVSINYQELEYLTSTIKLIYGVKSKKSYELWVLTATWLQKQPFTKTNIPGNS